MIKRLFTTENIIIAAVIFLAIFFAKFPTLYHWLDPPVNLWYPKSTTFFDAWDTNMQVSYIRYGQRHGIALQNTFTTVPHKPVLVFQFYTILGVLNRIFQLDPFILFHLASVVTSVGLLLVCYFIVRELFKDIVFRLASFIAIALGGGFGWLNLLNISADTKLAGLTLVNALERGHDALSTALLLLTLFFMYLYLKKEKTKYIFASIVCGIASFTLHPPFAAFYILTSIILAILEFKKSKSVKVLSVAPALLAAFGVYFLLVLVNLLDNPGFSGLVGQNLFVVSTFELALGFGLMALFLLWSLVTADSKDELTHTVFKIFFILQLLFLLSPLGFHLYFAKGLWIWGVVLAFYGIRNLITNQKIQNIVVTAVVALSLLSRFYVFSQLMEEKVNNPFFFLSKNEGDAINFMSSLPPDRAVLSLYRIGNYIPAHTDLKVYYGHKFQTPKAAEKLDLAEKFYLTDDEKLQREFLKQNNIQYIYYGWEEAQLRKDNKLPAENPFPYFPLLYQNDTALVYAATPSADKQ